MVADMPPQVAAGSESKSPVPPALVEEQPPGLKLWDRWFFWPIIALLFAVGVSVAVGYWGTARSVLFGWLFAAVAGLFIWISIKVYYTHVLVVSRAEGEPTVTIDVIHIPIDMMEQVSFSGATGYARDGKGRSLLIVKEFDEETLSARSSWESGLTYLDFFARYELIDDVLDEIRYNVMTYGEAKHRAVADLMADYDVVARQGDEILKLKDALTLYKQVIDAKRGP